MLGLRGSILVTLPRKRHGTLALTWFLLWEALSWQLPIPLQ